MCVVSNVGDDWSKRWPNNPVNPWKDTNPWWEQIGVPAPSPVSREEFDALKKEMEELKKLLKAAKEYDEKTGQPDCHMDEKVELIKKIAELVGVDLKGIFD